MDCIIYLYTAHLLYSLCVCREMSNCASILNSDLKQGLMMVLILSTENLETRSFTVP